MHKIEVNKHQNIKQPKSERINIKVSKDELKIINNLSERRNMNYSELLRTLLRNEDNKFTRSLSTYKCDQCKKKIKLGEEYYCEVASIEKQYKENGKSIIEVQEAKDLGVLCYPCAQKVKAIDYIKKGDPTYSLKLVKDSNRTIWSKNTSKLI